ncbi:MAG: hypothetical protein AAFV80_18410, partial [Bacteroidota bacterium]
IILLDENMPRQIAKGFHLLQEPFSLKYEERIEVLAIADEFGVGLPDEEWIPKVGGDRSVGDYARLFN